MGCKESSRLGWGAGVSRALALLMLVGVLVFAFVGTAFATYGQVFSIPALTPGSTVVINPTFTKATSDPGPASTHYFEVHVTGPNAQTNVVGVADGNWYPPVPTESGPGFTHFVSNEYITWVGNVGMLNPPPPSLKFNAAGTYQVEIRLCADTGVYPSPTWLQSTTYTVTVAPVVTTPASSPWSIALALVGALGVAVLVRRRGSAF
ncbi:MAG: hypothetical protein P4L93_04795 [Coriobacteriia bacterium]|nr:hypothetical protein [Coriobacteriia bacterium]